MNDAVLTVIFLFPLAFTFFFKSNAALSFLALCAGYTLQSFASTDIQSLLGKVHFSASSDRIGIFLIFIPPLITLILCRGPGSRSIKSPTVLINLLVALAIGLGFVLMAGSSIGSL